MKGHRRPHQRLCHRRSPLTTWTSERIATTDQSLRTHPSSNSPEPPTGGHAVPLGIFLPFKRYSKIQVSSIIFIKWVAVHSPAPTVVRYL
jgi:hypothetical protein